MPNEDAAKGSDSGSEKTWTRGNDPDQAREELRKANRGSTGGELNQPVPKQTPRG